ncbi:MAG: class I SAM-dependent DNA methyltransferase [Ferruginibacter sp.]|nr:class I SAM-dependent DNA methyltransferase [Ferruginibacter sp.]
MPLSWNEIKTRAAAFSKEWENEVSEDAEAKSFWDDFFNVFGIGRRRVATFEQQVKKIDNKTGFIDLLWKGVILVEHKSRGKDLDIAFQQAKDYFPGLKEKELPRYILVSDFERFRLYDLEEDCHHEFKLTDFVNHVHLFGFIAGYQKRTYKEQDPVNIEAAELMGKLHDKLKAIGYTGHHLELYLVRLLFCLFADDTSIFEKGILCEYFELKTNEDGSDLAAHIAELFQVLNTEENKRFKNLDEALAAFPYVNGKLFEEQLPMAHFDGEMRRILLDCCLLDWGKISPAIFGSLFQSVMDSTARRNLGAHYTSEKNILKLIKPLFLDELWAEFNKVKSDTGKLKKLHDKISKLRFLDPACGCGNFLIIAYRELRLLELDIVKALLKGQQLTSVNDYFLVDVDRFYGIEYEEFPSQIAQVAMWLMDHQMNEQASINFGEYYKRIPLKKSATIVHGNALRTDWQSLIDSMPWEKEPPRYHYILGNPPFIGTAYQNEEQKTDMANIFSGVNSFGMLDYVTAWYIKAAQYLQFANKIEEKDLPKTKVALVSTNSISQGEQVGILWNELFNKYQCKIHFAHRTFKWNNEAKGNAAVHVVIIGFSNFDITDKLIYEYENIKAEPHEISIKNINPYLVGASDNFLRSISIPICNTPKMQSGSAARDGGFLILTDDEKNELVNRNPKTKKYFNRFVSGDDFINNIIRWCIWLKGETPSEFREIKEFQTRFKEVKGFREKSTRAGTKKMAELPYLFAEERQPNHDFLIIPKVSSENRKYIPIAYLTKEFIVSDKTFVVPDTTSYHFGVLTSLMHMTWMKYVCGRLKSDFSYSNTIVYNNFPWPENPTGKQKEAIEKAAQAVLDARVSFPNSSLADLYDPNTMPPALVKAHNALDRAVDLCYRSQPFINETKRIEFLFELYDKYTDGLFVREKKKKAK